MQFIEFEHTVSEKDTAMSAPHSHEFYELYFLLKGQRNFFIDNKMFETNENTLVIVSPFSLHKTEGGPYERININVSPSLLTKKQNVFLSSIAKNTAIKLSNQYKDIIKTLLLEGAKIQNKGNVEKEDNLLSITKTILLFLSMQDTVSIAAISSAYKLNSPPTDVLKVIQYINNHYLENITLKSLCEEFYLSKMTLCSKFKKIMNCSVMEYIFELKLNKAKSLLKDTNKSIEEISGLCGFSSANYFGLFFKNQTGLSPMSYRKSR